MNKKGQFVLYGMKDYLHVVERIQDELELNDENIELKLILTEALNNAFIHGNKRSSEKPIHLRYESVNELACFEVEDTGVGFHEGFSCGGRLPDEYSECGRGLFLIESLADSVEYHGNKVCIKKKVK